jgi:DNA-binding NarL/FixJ family response regulator
MPPAGSKFKEWPFTGREGEVFHLLKQGKSNKLIAYELQLSESTIKAHIQKIMRKLNVTNRTAAVVQAL